MAKKGIIYAPAKNQWWNQFYAMMPTPEYIEDKNVIRIYFGVTDKDRNGRISFLEVDAANPSLVTYVSDEIIIDIGSPGTFDDSGVVPSSIVSFKNEKLLYYVGFQRCEKVPYMLFSGLAIENAEGKFHKFSLSPVIDRNLQNPLSNAAPFVMYDANKYKMWYWLGQQWITVNNKLYIQAEIFYAESVDGKHWNLFNKPCVKIDKEVEFSIGRPWVIKDNNIYKMWYSVRKIEKLYRLGYAESEDGINWKRKDEEIGIDVSQSGWDSEMICYPAVIKVKEKTFLFYNGNNNGETGFGYAELVKE